MTDQIKLKFSVVIQYRELMRVLCDGSGVLCEATWKQQ